MPWGEGPGELPPMRAASGEALVRMAARAAVLQLVGADELERDDSREAWHGFADLMQEAIGMTAMPEDAEGAARAKRLDAALAELRRARARVVAGHAGAVLFVAVIPIGDRRDLRAMFAVA